MKTIHLYVGTNEGKMVGVCGVKRFYAYNSFTTERSKVNCLKCKRKFSTRK